MLAVRYASVAIKGCRYDQVGATSCRPKIWSMFSCSRSNCKYSRKDMRFLCILTTDMGGMESSNTCIMLDIGGLVLHLFLAKPPISSTAFTDPMKSMPIPWGYPKDINIWAAQRGFTSWHRALFQHQKIRGFPIQSKKDGKRSVHLGKILSFWLALWCMMDQGCIGSHLTPDLAWKGCQDCQEESFCPKQCGKNICAILRIGVMILDLHLSMKCTGILCCYMWSAYPNGQSLDFQVQTVSKAWAWKLRQFRLNQKVANTTLLWCLHMWARNHDNTCIVLCMYIMNRSWLRLRISGMTMVTKCNSKTLSRTGNV